MLIYSCYSVVYADIVANIQNYIINALRVKQIKILPYSQNCKTNAKLRVLIVHGAFYYFTAETSE